MKLHPLRPKGPMPKAHNLSFGSFRRHFETIGNRRTRHDQRMVSSGLEGIGQLMEDGFSVMISSSTSSASFSERLRRSASFEMASLIMAKCWVSV